MLPSAERFPPRMNDCPRWVNDLSAAKQVNKRKRAAFSMRIGCPLYLWKTLKPFEIKGLGKKISPRQFYQNYRGDMVRVARLERAASTSQMWRPTNWATPGYFAVTIIARKSCDSKFFLSVVIYVVKAVFGPALLPGKIPQTPVFQGLPGFGCSHRG